MFKKKSSKVEFSLDSIIKNATAKTQLDGFIQEIELYKNQVKTANNGIKDIRNEAKDALGIPGKVLSKLVKERMDPGSINHEVTELDDIQQLAVGLGLAEDPDSNASTP